MIIGAPKILAAVLLSVTIHSHGALAANMEQGQSALAQGQYETARIQFRQAVDQGDLDALFNLARMYELGLGGEKKLDEAIKLYDQAAKQGNAASLNRMGLHYYRSEDGQLLDYAKAFDYFKAAFDAGDVNATFNLGQLYRKGQGVAADEGRALELFELAADKGHILALNTLGTFHKAQAGDDARIKAQEYFSRSASYGNALGLYELALAKLHDDQSRGSLISAHMYLNLASARGMEQATLSLQELSKAMSMSDILVAQAKAKEFKAIESEVRD